MNHPTLTNQHQPTNTNQPTSPTNINQTLTNQHQPTNIRSQLSNSFWVTSPERSSSNARKVSWKRSVEGRQPTSCAVSRVGGGPAFFLIGEPMESDGKRRETDGENLWSNRKNDGKSWKTYDPRVLFSDFWIFLIRTKTYYPPGEPWLLLGIDR